MLFALAIVSLAAVMLLPLLIERHASDLKPSPNCLRPSDSWQGGTRRIPPNAGPIGKRRPSQDSPRQYPTRMVGALTHRLSQVRIFLHTEA